MMDYNKYTMELTMALQEKLEIEGHVITGDLYNSIEFIFNPSTYSIAIELGAMEYIKFLDDGNFIDSFFESLEVETIMKEMVTEYITTKLDEI